MADIKRLISGIILTALISTITVSSAFAAKEYESVLKEYTKTGRVFKFDTLDALLIWKATLLSDELLQAQRDLIKKRKMDQEIPILPPEGVGFFLSVFVQKHMREFSMNKNSTWKIYLVGADGVETPPLKAEMITQTPTEWVLYPHLKGWYRAFYVEFPKIDLGSEPKLVLRSIVAESVLKWKVK